MKYGTVAVIPYDESEYDVTGIEYVEWEDRLEQAGTDFSTNTGKWITYEFLFDLGHFVSKPKGRKPKLPTPEVKSHPNAPKEAVDSWDERKNAREPVWTQSKILAEREKLLREKEKLFEAKQRAAVRRLVNKTDLRQPRQFYNDDGTPYTAGNYVSALMILMVIIIILAVCAFSQFF